MKDMPKIAVWLTVHSHEEQLHTTVKSVLDQTFKNFNLYLVVDAEDKKQWDLAGGYATQDSRVKIVCWQMQSEAEGVAMAIARLEEEYIAFLECGSEWKPNKLERQLAFLYAHPDMAACFTRVTLRDCEENAATCSEQESAFAESGRIKRLREFLSHTAELWTSSALIRREMYYHPRFSSAMLFKMPMHWYWLRLCKKAEVGVLPEELTSIGELSRKAAASCPTLAAVLTELNDSLSDQEFAKIFIDAAEEKNNGTHTRFDQVKHFFQVYSDCLYASELRSREQEIFCLLEKNHGNTCSTVRSVADKLEKNTLLKQIEIALYLQPCQQGEKERCLKQKVVLDPSGTFHARIVLQDVRGGIVRISAEDVPCTVREIAAKNEVGQNFQLASAIEKRDPKGHLTFWDAAPQFILTGVSGYEGAVHIIGCAEILLKDVYDELKDVQQCMRQQAELLTEAEKLISDKEQYISNCEKRIEDQQRHIVELEQIQIKIVNSFFWRITWPARAGFSFVKKVFSKAPGLRTVYRVLACLKDNGWEYTKEMCKDDIYYHRHFVGKTMPACRFENRAFLRKQASAIVQGPKISILVPLYHTPLHYLQEMVDSVRNQTYTNWELCLADAGLEEASAAYLRKIMKKEPRIRLRHLKENLGISGNTNAAMELATGEYFALLDHDDLLHPSALWYMATEIAQGADFVYTDELTFEDDILNVKNYAFKPDFAPEMLRSCNYICHFSAFSRTLVEKAGGGFRSEYDGSQDYDMVLRLTEQADKVAHIQHVLYYWRASATSVASDISAKQYCLDAAIAALQAHLERLHLKGTVSLIPQTPGFYKIDYALTAKPLISILIPSCDHIEELDQCIVSILERSSYKNYEILIVENNSRRPETFEYYKKLENRKEIRVLYYPKKEPFNYSKLNNFAARHAAGEVFLLLNNDMEILSENWLEEMLMYAQQPDVGAVGAMLYFPDDTVQHAGVGIGIGGIAGHLHKYFSRGSHGYMGRLHYAQNVSAVTGACLMLRREVYERLNGLNEQFAVAFNDVDFCMRIREAGYRIVFTPYAELYHYESKSRGAETTPEKQKRFLGEIKLFQQCWEPQLQQGDPYYNPNLSLYSEQFEIAVRPLPEV